MRKNGSQKNADHIYFALETQFTPLQSFSCACKFNLRLQSYVHLHKSYRAHANLYGINYLHKKRTSVNGALGHQQLRARQSRLNVLKPDSLLSRRLFSVRKAAIRIMYVLPYCQLLMQCLVLYSGNQGCIPYQDVLFNKLLLLMHLAFCRLPNQCKLKRKVYPKIMS